VGDTSPSTATDFDGINPSYYAYYVTDGCGYDR
jgi:hypothetical protein